MNRRRFLKLSSQLGAAACLGCAIDEDWLLPARKSAKSHDAGLRLLARFAHVTDTHLMDEESPARFPGAHEITHSAWRPYEAYSTHLLDGVIRAFNRLHSAGRTVDFLLHTGDACDNAQGNELDWLIRALDGGTIDPRSGPDDRPLDARPEPSLDPHAPFTASGLYRSGVHGDAPSIPWYAVLGNHDAYGLGVFPILDAGDGRRIAPLPLPGRPGFVLPVVLDPTAAMAHGRITPAQPGPPNLFTSPQPIEPNQARAYFDREEYVETLRATAVTSDEHGFRGVANGTSWYSVQPVPGVRLIGLDTTVRAVDVLGGVHSEGSLRREQLAFLEAELAGADVGGEIVIVATHHPSEALGRLNASEVGAEEFRAVLRTHPRVILHVAGHRHRNRVTDRDGYVELETCSTLDWPQEGRLIEFWEDPNDGSITLAYEMVSHLDDALPALGPDPLRALRTQAQNLARLDKGATARRRRFDPSGADPSGGPTDRHGFLVMGRRR